MTCQSTSTPASVLVADDDEALCTSLARYLTTQGYDVTTADSGPAALERLRETPVSLALLDVDMPGMSGVEVVPQALEIAPDVAILMLSGVNDAATAVTCMQFGALDYLTKPIELSELSRAIQRGLRRRQTVQHVRELEGWLREELGRLGHEVDHARQRQKEITLATLEALITALEAKNPYLRGHSARVAALAATIAHELRLTDEEIDQVRMAGGLHDVGMIGIREEILNKQGALTSEEHEHVKEHVVIGARILEPLTDLGPVVDFVRSHHEHWDGRGYPYGLRGERIPIGGRVIGTAEVYDALTTARPYQEKVPPEEAIDRMRSLAGTVLDPRTVDALSIAVARRRTLVFLDEGGPPVAETLDTCG